MQKKILIPAVAALVLLGAGCGKSVAQKAADKAVEKATNGTVKVDTTTNTARVNINGNTIVVGDAVKLPTDFPSDIYVIDGTLKSAVTTVAGKMYSLAIESAKTPTEVDTLYKSKLQADGWKIVTTANINGSVYLMASKSNRSVTITAGAGENSKTAVGVLVSQTESTSPPAPSPY